VQRVFAPEVARLVADRDKARAELDGLGADRDRLFRELAVAFESVTAAHQGIADLQAEQRALRERLDHTLLFAEAMAPRLEPLEDGLLEARRQSLRIAELADVVTEIVLPLHDRDIDPSAVEKLRTDTF
jgi:uncharacterized protein (DUF3084 family)